MTTYLFLCWNTQDIMETESRVFHHLEPARLYPESKVSVFTDRSPSKISDNPLSFAAGHRLAPTIFWLQDLFLDVPLEGFPMPHGDVDGHTRSSLLSTSRETPFSSSCARCVVRIQGLRIIIRGWSGSVLRIYAYNDLLFINNYYYC